MGGLRFFPLVAITACANLSGLSDLEVGDGGAQDSGSQDVTAEATVDASGDVAPLDGPSPDEGGVKSFCQTQTQSYVWCADFDDGDVTHGYLNGQKSSWTGVSQSKPSLSTQNVSAPYSAGFDASLSQSLTFTGTPSNQVPYELQGELRIDSFTDGLHDVATVQTSGSYGIKLQISHNGNLGWSLTITEATFGADGGLQLTLHPTTGTFSTAVWVPLSVSISLQQVSVSINNGAPQAFDRAQTGSSQSVTTTLVFDQPTTTGEWDDIRIAM